MPCITWLRDWQMPRNSALRNWQAAVKDNKQLNDFVPAGTPLTEFYKAPDTVWTPHVLKDGSDSVGALGALNRVFINIGLFSEEWLNSFSTARLAVKK